LSVRSPALEQQHQISILDQARRALPNLLTQLRKFLGPAMRYMILYKLHQRQHMDGSSSAPSELWVRTTAAHPPPIHFRGITALTVMLADEQGQISGDCNALTNSRNLPPARLRRHLPSPPDRPRKARVIALTLTHIDCDAPISPNRHDPCQIHSS
jgi:hypothetical protein